MQFAWIEDEEELRQVIEGGDFAKWRVFLHPEQRKYVGARTNGPFRLSGGAGTGKTVVLLHRARELSRRDPERAHRVDDVHPQSRGRHATRPRDPRPRRPAGRRAGGARGVRHRARRRRAVRCEQGGRGVRGTGCREGPGAGRQSGRASDPRSRAPAGERRSARRARRCRPSCRARRSSPPSTHSWCCPPGSRPRTSTSRVRRPGRGVALNRAPASRGVGRDRQLPRLHRHRRGRGLPRGGGDGREILDDAARRGPPITSSSTRGRTSRRASGSSSGRWPPRGRTISSSPRTPSSGSTASASS